MVLSDEIYDHILYDDAEFVPMATLVHDTLCCTMSGLSKVYRACGYRVGWASFSGDIESAGEYLSGLELLSSLRLCSNVPGQWAVQTALGGYQSILRTDASGRPAVRVAADHSRRRRAQQVSRLARPMGALYAFVEVRERRAAGLRRSGVCARAAGEQACAGRAGRELQRALSQLLSHHQSAGAAESSRTVFARIEELLEAQAAAGPELQIVGSAAKVEQH